MMKIIERHGSNGIVIIEGYVVGKEQSIISINNIKGYWIVESSSNLPADINKAELHLKCMEKVMVKWREYRDCF